MTLIANVYAKLSLLARKRPKLDSQSVDKVATKYPVIEDKFLPDSSSLSAGMRFDVLVTSPASPCPQVSTLSTTSEVQSGSIQRQNYEPPTPASPDDCSHNVSPEITLRLRGEEVSSIIAGFILSALEKFDALDWQSCIHQCELALRWDADNVNALMLRAIATVKGLTDGDLVEQGKAVAAGISAAMREPNKRFSTLVAYALSEACGDEEVDRVEKLVKTNKTDRAALALLLTLHFKRWYWGEHPESFAAAIEAAHMIQRDSPNDRVAMSALFYLIGDFGRGNREAIDFAARRIIPGDDFYHKSEIRPRAIFDYPMFVQRPDMVNLGL